MRHSRRAYVLLDVILSITILSAVVLTSLRAFHQSLRAVRRGEISSRAAMYAEAKLQEFQIQPPGEDGRLSGIFSEEVFYDDEDLYPDASNFEWVAEFEEIELEYDDVRLARRDQDKMHTLWLVNLRIVHDDGDEGFTTSVPVEIDTYLLGHERFSAAARRENDL